MEFSSNDASIHREDKVSESSSSITKRAVDTWAIVSSCIEYRKMQVAYAALFLVCLVAWFGYTRDIDLYFALKGFSPIDWVNHITFPTNFTKDFPSGVENYRSSAFMYIYLLFYQHLGISPETLLSPVIFIEIFALACAVFYLSRTLRPEAPMLVAFLVVLNIISGHVGEMNLARFETTFYKGLFYNIADALRIFFHCGLYQ